jgi:hypothetical protein
VLKRCILLRKERKSTSRDRPAHFRAVLADDMGRRQKNKETIVASFVSSQRTEILKSGRPDSLALRKRSAAHV